MLKNISGLNELPFDLFYTSKYTRDFICLAYEICKTNDSQAKKEYIDLLLDEGIDLSQQNYLAKRWEITTFTEYEKLFTMYTCYHSLPGTLWIPNYTYIKNMSVYPWSIIYCKDDSHKLFQAWRLNYIRGKHT